MTSPDTSTQDVADILGAWKREVDGALEGVVDRLAAGTGLAPFADAIRYSLLGPGKRIRPALVRAAAATCDVDAAHALPVACAFELIHAYSLVHDDLPCMDDDDMRRGRPTSHKVYGDAIATLVGDALQAEAFAQVADAVHLSDGVRVRVLSLLANRAGWTGMVGGQYLDIVATHTARDFDALREVHSRKTGALIAGAVQAGAILGEVAEAVVEDFARFGRSLGWLFQLVDDILDVTGDDTRTGRPAGSDERHSKVTALAVFGGVEEARRAADEELERCLAFAADLPHGGGLLPVIASYVRTRDH
jgi:geranylgeranyl diphosphate synthase type II